MNPCRGLIARREAEAGRCDLVKTRPVEDTDFDLLFDRFASEVSAGERALKRAKAGLLKLAATYYPEIYQRHGGVL